MTERNNLICGDCGVRYAKDGKPKCFCHNKGDRWGGSQKVGLNNPPFNKKDGSDNENGSWERGL
jgi:hypothetical protein